MQPVLHGSLAVGVLIDFGICFGMVVGWTELAKEAPEFRSCLAPTPATPFRFDNHL